MLSTSFLRSYFCNFSASYIILKETSSVTRVSSRYRHNRRLIFKNCLPFASCIYEINNMHVESTKYGDIVLPTHNLSEYSKGYCKTSGSLWQYIKDKPS